MLGTLWRGCTGRFSQAERGYIPHGELAKVSLEVRVMVTLYAAITLASILTASWLAVTYWLLPRILGEPLLRAIRMTEHTCYRIHAPRLRTRSFALSTGTWHSIPNTTLPPPSLFMPWAVFTRKSSLICGLVGKATGKYIGRYENRLPLVILAIWPRWTGKCQPCHSSG
jgi:hypothetical protein